MRGVQTARISLFLVLIATGVVVAHVLAIGVADSARKPVVVSDFELSPSPFRRAPIQDDDAPGYVVLTSLEEAEPGAAQSGVVRAGGCSLSGCCSKSSAPTASVVIAESESDAVVELGEPARPALIELANSTEDSEACPACCAKTGTAACCREGKCDKVQCPASDAKCCESQTCTAASCAEGACSAAACKSEAAACEEESEVVTSDAEVDAVPAPTAPEALLAPDNAVPIGPELPMNTNTSEPAEIFVSPKSAARKEAEVRSVIEQELPEAREDEREIWLDELKGLPPEMVRELLRLRSDFNASNGGGIPDVIAPPPPIVMHEDNHQNLDLDSKLGLPLLVVESEVLSHLEPTLDALRQASRVILNNIANANTTGFKRSTVIFSDAEYEQLQLPVSSNAGGKGASAGISIGNGAQIAATRTDFGPGILRQTGRAFDLAISGDGFFQVRNAEGQAVYTRAGTFAVNADGAIVVAGIGAALEPAVKISQNTAELNISNDGAVTASEAGKPDAAAIGQIQIVKFPNPEGLLPLGNNLFGATDASGAPNVGTPNSEGRGKVRQRHLEASNVNVATELIALQEILQQIEVLQQAASIMAPGLSVPSAPTPQHEPSDDDGKPSRFTRRRHPQQTSEHIRPDRAKR